MKTFSTALLVFVTTALVAACGGGGGDAGTSPFTPGNPDATTAAHLTLQLSSSSILNGGTASVTATATATTSSGQAVAGIPVTFSVDNGATFTQSSATTGATGQAAAVVSPGADPSNRVITVKASAGSLTASAPFAITGTTLTATGSAVVLPSSASNTVNFRLTDANGIAIAGQSISVVAGSIGTTAGTTGTNGEFVYTYTAPATAGSLDIVGSAGGVTKTLTVLVQSGSGSIAPAMGPISSASVSANPSVVSTNSVATSNRTEIRALFVGLSNAPIARVRVRFDLNGDANSIGGTFSTGPGTVIYSDANGIATTSYIPGDRASPTNGVTIRACYSIVDFTSPTDCPNATTATVTVVSDPLSVSIGSNNIILIGPNNLTYRRQFVVLVVDASGRAKANVDIIPSIDLPIFFKGQFGKNGGAFVAQPTKACLNEDLNRNGVLESTEEDPNGNTSHVGNHSGAIDPRKSDTSITILGTGKTDDNGSAIVQIEYPQNVANWLQVRILISATGVSGTEGRATWTEILPIPVDTLAGPATPPFVVSPYGVITANASPTNLTNETDPSRGRQSTFPDGAPGTSGVIAGQSVVAPCNNPY